MDYDLIIILMLLCMTITFWLEAYKKDLMMRLMHTKIDSLLKQKGGE